MTKDPVPDFTLDELKAFLRQKPEEPIETDFRSAYEWAQYWGCNSRLAHEMLRQVKEQDALEVKKGHREAIDGKMRPVPVYKINLKAEEAPA